MPDSPDSGRLGDSGLKPPVTNPPGSVAPKPPVTHPPPKPPPVAPPGGATGPDPALASWANFGVEVVSAFRTNWIDAYSPQTHKYDPRYIKPNGYEIRLNASIGLRMGKGAQSVARVIDPTQGAPRPR
jgi:hypothetical protein